MNKPRLISVLEDLINGLECLHRNYSHKDKDCDEGNCNVLQIIYQGKLAVKTLDDELKESQVLPDEAQLLLHMETYGGHFASNLAKAWIRADSSNRKLLRQSFNDLLKTYRQFAHN